MPLVNMDSWLSERGMARADRAAAAPDPLDPRDVAIDALSREVSRQSDLISQLQAALRQLLAERPLPQPAPRTGRVKRAPRSTPPRPAETPHG